MAPDAGPNGYLVVKVIEATGLNSEEARVWGDSLKDAFVRVELRGGLQNWKIRKQTSVQPVEDDSIRWDEQLALEAPQDSNELRVLLCSRRPAGSNASLVFAACGVYVKELLEAVPLDKFFELYQPGTGEEAGFIRVSMNYLRPDQVRPGSLPGVAVPGSNGVAPGATPAGGRRGLAAALSDRRSLALRIGGALIAAGIAATLARRVARQGKKGRR